MLVLHQTLTSPKSHKPLLDHSAWPVSLVDTPLLLVGRQHIL